VDNVKADTKALLIGDATKSRIFAVGIDNLGAMFLASLLVARCTGIPESVHGVVAVFIYLGYFGLQDGAWSTTIGKRLFGLRIARLDGTACGWRAALLRTVTRLIEVNPILLGGLPAGLMIAFSKRRQRLGDWIAGTVVVRRTASVPTARVSTRVSDVQPAIERLLAQNEQMDAASPVRGGQFCLSLERPPDGEPWVQVKTGVLNIFYPTDTDPLPTLRAAVPSLPPDTTCPGWEARKFATLELDAPASVLAAIVKELFVHFYDFPDDTELTAEVIDLT